MKRIALVVALAACAAPPPADDTVALPDSAEWAACRTQVTESLTTPATAQFAPGDSVHFVSLREGQRTAASYVDAQNAYGALTRMQFICTAHYSENRFDSVSVQRIP